MLTCKNTTSRKAVDYFKHDYIEGRSRWFGKGAASLGLSGAIDHEQIFSNVLSGRSPDGQQQLSARAVDASTRRAALDCTFSAPKSVSLQALVSGDERLIAAHQLAVEKTLALMEQRYSFTRVTISKTNQSLNTSNLVIAQFDHIESRELDPHLHTHSLIMNLTEFRKGEWYSLQNDEIYANKKFLGMVYQSFLSAEVQKLGYEVEPRKHGQFEIKGYREEDLVEFSKRRQQILGAVGSDSSWALREKAWDVSRKNKKQVPPEELKAKWKEEAQALNITFVTSKNISTKLNPPGIEEKILESAIAHCTERKVAFKQEELEAFILEQGLATDVAQIESSLSSCLDLIPIPGQDRSFTTKAALQRELNTIALMQDGQGKVQAIAHTYVVESQLEATSLNSGQRQAVQLAATTNDQFIAWQGVAGAGKTFALKELKAIASSSHSIKAFAPSAQAAKVLSDELGVQAQTVARLLVSEQPHLIEPNQIWIVDEASLLSAYNAQALLERATKEQARVVFVGDTRQLSAVEAGNPFKSLQQAGIKTAHLNESLRQRTPELKLAVDLIAEGRVEAGFARLEENGSIQIVTADAKIETIASEYMATAPESRAKTLILAGTNAERLAITEAIRTQLKANGGLGTCENVIQLQARNDLTSVQMRSPHNFEIGDIVMPTRNYKRRGLQKGELYEVVGKSQDRLNLKSADGRYLNLDLGFDKAVYRKQKVEIAVGDRLRWTKNDRQLARRNGQEFVVTGIEDGSATIEYLFGDQTDRIDLADAQHLDHALVSTTYGSQGKTADRVLVATDYTTGQESFYVAVSRARRELKLYTEDKSRLLELALLTKAKENPLELLNRELILQVESQRKKVTPLPLSLEDLPYEYVVDPSSKPEASLVHELLGSGSVTANAKNAIIKEKPSSSVPPSVAPIALKPKPKPIIKRNEPTEAFWIPDPNSAVPPHIDPQHWQEIVNKSAIHPDIAELNFRSLQQDPLEHEHEAWAHLMYSDQLERSNPGRLSSVMLKRYSHIEAGGWWCSAGVDPRTFLDLQAGTKPQEKIWGCFKPNAPRENPDKPGKKIKYEHPPKTDLSIFLLDVPDSIAERIYEKAGIKPTENDRTSGFWYCVWKYNLPCIITEGAKKAASLLSQGHATIGLPGIYAGYRTKDEQGNQIRAILHQELAVFATPDREMKICFDYETRPETKRNIDIAILRTGGLLERNGAKVSVVSLSGPAKGVDDLIVASGPLAYDSLDRQALRLKAWREKNFQQHRSLQPPLTLSLESRKEQVMQKLSLLRDEELLFLVKLVVENDPQILQNQVLLEVLKSPQILDRLTSIQQQQQERQVQFKHSL